MIDAEIPELTPQPTAAARMRARTDALSEVFDTHLPSTAARTTG